MNKNNKGFTLVELLAAIVILGIMVFYAAPQIANMLDTNKNKVYVSDAKKMIAQTEYKLKSSSSVIEKPSNGACIVVSLIFLDDDDFDSPPNQGEYVKESSFVVVKNNNGTLEYAATIVEKMKKGGGYKGVKLTSSQNLKKNDATKYVTSFKKSELFSLTSERDRLTTGYINGYLGTNYVSQIDNVYNYPDLSDSSDKKSLVIPNIVSAALSSASNKGYNSLDAVLTLKIIDVDSLKSDIKVYISETGYTDQVTPINYGSMDPFKKEINFADPNRSPGAKAYSYDGSLVQLYIIAKDESGNEDRKIVEYRLHTNLPPEISDENSELTKLPADKENMTTARLKLAVSDDIDDIKDLQVCFSEDENATTCSNYQSYGSYFGNGNTYEYSFNRDKCNLDGSLLHLKAFLRDSYGEEVTKTFAYQLYSNKAPEIKKVTIKPIAKRFTSDGSLDVYVKVDATDDISIKSNITIDFTDGVAHPPAFSYSEDTEVYFTFSGGYDGKERTLQVSATDECGKKTTYYQAGSSTPGVKYKVYKNLAPKISNVNITSNESACKNIDYDKTCENANGRDTTVSFEVTDDIDFEDNYKNVKVCASTNPSDCTDISKYKSFNDYADPFPIDVAPGASKPYDGGVKNFYIYAIDTSDAKSEQISKYTIYKNKAPKITQFLVESQPEKFITRINHGGEEGEEVEQPTGEEVGSLNTNVFLDGMDDLDDFSNLSYSIKEEKGNTLGNVANGSLTNYDPEDGISFTLKGPYDGTTRKITLELTDDYGSTMTKTVDYKVYKNLKPEINNFSVESFSDDCEDNNTCDIGNNNKVRVNLDVYDDIDSSDSYDCDEANGNCSEVDKCKNPIPDPENPGETICDDPLVCVRNSAGKLVDEKELNTPESQIMVCVSEDQNYCDPSKPERFRTYSDYTNLCGSDAQYYTFNEGLENPLNGDSKHLYVVVKDSLGETDSSSVEYEIYNNQGPEISTNLLKIESEENDFAVNISRAHYNIVATDDLTPQENLKVKICYTQGDSTAETCLGDYRNYQEEYDIDFGITNYQGQELHVYSYVKDEHGVITKSDPLIYTLYNDLKPEITQAQAAYKLPGKADNEVGFSIIVKDPFDTYQVCINKNENANTCTFSGSYSGSDLASRKLFITDADITRYIQYLIDKESENSSGSGSGGSGGSGSTLDCPEGYISDADGKECIPKVIDCPDEYMPNEDGTECVPIQTLECTEGYKPNEAGTECIPDSDYNLNRYYIFVKDSHGKVSDGKELRAQEYIECNDTDDSTTNYQYTLLSSQGITHQRCGGRCYYYNKNEEHEFDVTKMPDIQDTSSIKSTYRKKTFALDSFKNTKTCTPAEEQIEVGCDFYQCFQTGTNAYDAEVIGLYLNTLDEDNAWTYKDANGQTTVELDYYTVYTTSYNPKNGDSITYNPTNNRYPSRVVANLTYDSSSSKPYIRIIDTAGSE